MTDRIVDLSDEPAMLSTRHDNLVIQRAGQPDVAIPFPDIAVLLVSHPVVRFTHAALSGLASAGGVFVCCAENRLPVAMMLPIAGNFVQGERLRRQANVKEPLKKQLWKSIVKAKIQSQAALLNSLHGDDAGLGHLANDVKSGDSTGCEAQAARRYWPALFASRDFRRDRDAQDANRFLNYGYAVLRSVVARAICAAGLHPTLGLHHHNKYDAYALADDLMEPFRPLVDKAVWEVVQNLGADTDLDKHVKAAIIEALLVRLDVGGERRTLFDICARMAKSLDDVFAGRAKKLMLPDFRWFFPLQGHSLEGGDPD